jgi:phosphoserine aminotransferase
MSQPYDRVYNFSAGPCTLPVDVLEEIRDDLLNHKGAGMSVMEMSHRSKTYEAIHYAAMEDFRKLFRVPDNYKVLFLTGGASMQFSMIPIAFLRGRGVADYITTGTWGKKSEESAMIEGKVNVIFDGKPTKYDRIPDWDKLNFTPGAEYVYFTSNETIQGVQFKEDPTSDAPLVVDMCSDILSRPVDIDKYALIYAGAQKNMGPAGVTVVVIRDDFMEKNADGLSPMLDYREHAKADSIYNTPPCWNIYVCGLVYKNYLKNGGLEGAQKRNEAKSKILYDAIDNSGGFYKGHAQLNCRSTMNVSFTLPSDDLTNAFVKEAETHKLDGLKGHRSVGGIRASIYNAFPEEGCRVLADFMKQFAARNG